MAWKRSGNRHFDAKRLGQKQDLVTITFLGQQFIIVAQSGNRKNRRYNLLGPEGTDLAGVLLKGVTIEALRRYRDDKSAVSHFDID